MKGGVLIIEFKEILCNSEKRIVVIFKFNQNIIDRIKSISGRVWDKENKYWYLPYIEDFETVYGKFLKSQEIIENENIFIQNTVRFMENRRYSNKTIEQYKKYLVEFKKFINKDLPEITNEEISEYIKNVWIKAFHIKSISKCFKIDVEDK